MIGVLSDSEERALRQLRFERSLEFYDEKRRLGTFASGRQFLLFTEPFQLKDVRLSDFRVIGPASKELVAAARARMSH